MKLLTSLLTFLLVVGAHAAYADPGRDRTVDMLNKLSDSAAGLAKTAKASDDRGARKKVAPAATDLGDDLAALARRTAKGADFKSIGKDADAIARSAVALVDLADEIEDKDERKAVRSQAQLIAQGVALVRKQIEEAAKSDGGGGGGGAAQRFNGRLLNNSDACSWAENLKFVVSRDGQQVFTSQMVFPGKDLAVALDKGRYLVQFFDTSGKHLGQNTLDANREGWTFKSGCVNQD